MKTSKEWIWVVVFVASCLFVNWRVWDRAESHDPDSEYHSAIAKQFSQSILPRKIPQADDLSWKEHFPGQHFLFSALTGMGYRIGGERGLDAICALFSALSILLLVALLRLYVSLPTAIALAALAVLFSPFFAMRVFANRPLVFTVFGLLGAFYCVLRSRHREAAAFGVFYAWSHYTLYLPIALLAIPAIATSNKERRKAAVWAMAGIGLASFIHPYFPYNWVSLYQSLLISLGGRNAFMGSQEMLPLSASAFLFEFSFYLIILILGAFALGLLRSAKWKDKEEILIWQLTSLALWVLSMKTPRGLELAIPFAIVLAASIIPVLQKAWVHSGKALIGLGFLLLAPTFWIGILFPPVMPNHLFAIRKALEAIPPGPAKVFNCAWSDSAVILNRRPDLSFVDILDPIFLATEQPTKDELRWVLLRGTSAFPQDLLRKVFAADYVLCNEPAVITQLEADPGFIRLAPSLYRVSAQPRHEWIQDFEILRGENWTPLGKRAPYLHFGSGAAWLSKDAVQIAGQLGCVTVRPTREAKKRITGRGYLGLGGGPLFGVMVSGRKWFSNVTPNAIPRSVNYLIPITSAEKDLEVRVCSRVSDPFWGLSLSFWKKDEIDQRCFENGVTPFGAPSPQCPGTMISMH